jgi:hypothetical protein
MYRLSKLAGGKKSPHHAPLYARRNLCAISDIRKVFLISVGLVPIRRLGSEGAVFPNLRSIRIVSLEATA